MIKVQGKLPRSVYVACSGGADSMAVVDFLSRKHDVEVIFFHHGSDHDTAAQQLVYDYCQSKNIECILGGMNRDDKIKPGMSKEDFWRWRRYRFFEQFSRPETPVITCHHLDDCAETWIWRSLNGNPDIIPYCRGNVIRPFRLNRKKDLELWAQLNGVPYLDDPTNTDTAFTRNYIRHELMPHALKVNPGLYKVIKKKVMDNV
jgi:tRNA(Ile)-lysidine synthase